MTLRYTYEVHRNLTEIVHMRIDGSILDISTEIGFALWIVSITRADYEQEQVLRWEA